MSAEGQHYFDALGKEKTKVLTFTKAVHFLKRQHIMSLKESCHAEKHCKILAPSKSQFS